MRKKTKSPNLESQKQLANSATGDKVGFWPTCVLIFLHNLYASCLLSLALNCTCLNSLILFATGKWMINLGEGDNVHDPNFVWMFWIVSTLIIIAIGSILAGLECRKFKRRLVHFGELFKSDENDGLPFRRYYIETEFDLIRVSKSFWNKCDTGEEFICGITRKPTFYRLIFYLFYPTTSCNKVSLWGPFEPVKSGDENPQARKQPNAQSRNSESGSTKSKKLIAKTKKDKDSHLVILKELPDELRIVAEARLSKKEGDVAVGRAIRWKYIILGCPIGFAIYALLVNGFLWIFSDTWLVPMSLGEAVGTVMMEQGPIHLFVCLGISVVVSLCLAFREFKSFKRIMVRIQSRMAERRIGDHGELETYRLYVAKFDSTEVEIPASIGKRFSNKQLAICGVTTTLFRKRKKLWKPFEPLQTEVRPKKK